MRVNGSLFIKQHWQTAAAARGLHVPQPRRSGRERAEEDDDGLHVTLHEVGQRCLHLLDVLASRQSRRVAHEDEQRVVATQVSGEGRDCAGAHVKQGHAEY